MTMPLFAIAELFDKKTTRTAEPDGTFTEETVFTDIATKKAVCKIRRHFASDGVTPTSAIERWFDGPVDKQLTFERYTRGTLREKETWVFDSLGRITGKTIEEHEGGEVRRRTEYGPALDYDVEETFEFGHDRSGRLIRITQRDARGAVKVITTYDYLMDGSHSRTTTDYSKDPPTVTRVEYDPDGYPR